MTSPVVVRPARPQDAPALARVHVETWRETYRGQMRDDVLDDPGAVARRERFWRTVLSDDRFRDQGTAVAERDGDVVGLALAGPPADADGPWTTQLYVLYTLAAVHGSGAGTALLSAVLTDVAEPEASVMLWVAAPNPRAQAFYRKHGFAPDGASTVDDGVREIRMVRPPATRAAGPRHPPTARSAPGPSARPR